MIVANTRLGKNRNSVLQGAAELQGLYYVKLFNYRCSASQLSGLEYDRNSKSLSSVRMQKTTFHSVATLDYVHEVIRRTQADPKHISCKTHQGGKNKAEEQSRKKKRKQKLQMLLNTGVHVNA